MKYTYSVKTTRCRAQTADVTLSKALINPPPEEKKSGPGFTAVSALGWIYIQLFLVNFYSRVENKNKQTVLCNDCC